MKSLLIFASYFLFKRPIYDELFDEKNNFNFYNVVVLKTLFFIALLF